MYYSEARPLIKSGDLLAWSHHGWGSWYDIKIQLVRIFTRSEYSHVGVAWVIGKRVFVLEATNPHVRIYPLSKADDFYWIPMGAEWTEEVESYALSKIGEKYSTKDAIKAFFSLPIDNREWECAEYVKEVLAKAKIFLGNKLIPSKIVQRALEFKKPMTYVIAGK